MALFKRNIDFMGIRRRAFAFSGVLIVASVVLIAVRGLNFGLDFSGGTVVELAFDAPVSAAQLREQLDACGFHGAVVQTLGTDADVLVRVPPQDAEAQRAVESGPCQLTGAAAAAALDAEATTSSTSSADNLGHTIADRLHAVLKQQFKVQRNEFVGPAVGAELREQGGLAILAAIGLVLVYVLFRFTFKLAIGAIVALLHDPIVTLGAFALFQWEFDLSVLAAVLAVLGYSINDSIVVADRIRENFRVVRRGTPAEVVNLSINQTLDRTVMTSATTLLTMIALFFFGGDVVHGFATAMIIGIVIGTYSSIYVSATFALILGMKREDLLEIKREQLDDGRP